MPERKDPIVAAITEVSSDEAIEHLRRAVLRERNSVWDLEEKVGGLEKEREELSRKVSDLTNSVTSAAVDLVDHGLTIDKLTKTRSALEAEVESLKANVPRKGDVVAQMLSKNTKQIKELLHENVELKLKVAELSKGDG